MCIYLAFGLEVVTCKRCVYISLVVRLTTPHLVYRDITHLFGHNYNLEITPLLYVVALFGWNKTRFWKPTPIKTMIPWKRHDCYGTVNQKDTRNVQLK